METSRGRDEPTGDITKNGFGGERDRNYWKMKIQ